MQVKIIKIKENKDGSADFEIEYEKDLELLITKRYGKKFTSKLLERAIIEGLENYLKKEEGKVS